MTLRTNAENQSFLGLSLTFYKYKLNFNDHEKMIFLVKKNSTLKLLKNDSTNDHINGFTYQ